MVVTLRRMLHPYATRSLWQQTAHLLLDLPVGIATFTVAITLLSLSLGLMVTLVGLPLLAGTVLLGRVIGSVERTRAAALLDTRLPGFVPLQQGGSWWERAKRTIGDGPGWRGLGYSLLMLPWGIIAFTITVTLWSLAWSLALVPLYGWILDGPPAFDVNGTAYHLHGWSLVGVSAAACLLGWVLVALLPRVIAGLARADEALIRTLLSPGKAAALHQRVNELEVSREASVESAAGELRRIERDLHDGAQQRLVSLAMNLGMAKERMREVDDPRARQMVEQAHDEAKLAIAELRDLVRGIHPAVLTDRGLDAAVSALVARCPVPVALHSNLPRRYPSAIEATAYFVIAEALTNVAKHSAADRASVSMLERAGHLVVEVHDDGVGGAAESTGGGLRGLRDRVTAVEGRLRIASPPGGPTAIVVELPCES